MCQSSTSKGLLARLATFFHLDGAVSKDIRLLLCFLVGLILGGFSVYASADYPASVRYSYDFWSDAPCNNGWEQPGSSPGALCGAAVGCRNQIVDPDVALASTSWSEASGTGSCKASSGNAIANYRRDYYCPNGGTLQGTTCVVPNPCEQGAASSATWWNGCFDVDGLDNGCDAGSRLPYPTSGVCNGTCVVSISNWSSCQMPVGGGPITCTGSGTLTGSQCQPGDNYIPSSAMKCPTGYSIGTVNGVPGCYQTGTPSPATTTTTNTTGSGTTTTTTVKSDPNTNTKTTTTTTTNTTTGDQQTTTTTAPLDPSKPMTGKENKAPGQEPLKIDESGTPTDGSLSAQKADYEAKSNERKSLIDSMANQGNHGLTWDWQFDLPSGGCSAYTFTIAGRSFTLDPCEKLGWIRDALGFLIYITTALALLSIATGQGREGK